MRAIYLKTILTSIARTGDDDIADSLHGIKSQFLTGKTQHTFHDILCLRSLYGNLTIEVTAVLQIDVEACGMLLHPSPVLINVGSIDDKEEIVLSHLIHQQVVHRTTILVAHHAIKDLSCRHTCYVVRKDMVHIALRILALYRHLAHVRHIKQPHMLTDSHVLWCYSRILVKEGHVKSAELHHRSP